MLSPCGGLAQDSLRYDVVREKFLDFMFFAHLD